MTGYDGIRNVLRQMRDRRFTFTKYRQGRAFSCYMCKRSGRNGYILEDENGEQITVGKGCFHDYFLIHPSEVT